MPARSLDRRRRVHVPALALALVLALTAPAPATASWLRPVPGEVVRPFDYSAASPFEAGAHRGADLAAAPGAAVRSACSGRVAHVGAVARLGRVVTVVCGSRRVTYLPLASVAAREHEPIARGGLIGALAGGHDGLHVGVRRAGAPFAYEDPLARMRDEGGVPPVQVVPIARARPRARRPVGLRPRLAPRAGQPPLSPAPHAPPAARAAPLHGAPRAHAPPAGRVAPWPVWAGITLVLAGAVGSSTLAVRHRRAGTERVGAHVRRVEARG